MIARRAGSTVLSLRGAWWHRHGLVRVVTRRLVLAVPLLFIVSALSFLLLSLTPGDAAQQILGIRATPSSLAALRQQLGLNLSLPAQYWRWLTHATHGDLGTSVYTGQPVSKSITERLPVSLSLIVSSLVVMSIVGVSLGVFSAFRGGVAGRSMDALALLGFALPSFWVGAIMIEFFAVRFHVFPAVGYVPLATSAGEWLRSLALPVFALAIGGVATIAKQTREAMLDVLASEHIRMAWANGIPARRIYFRYALRNVGTRVLTIMGLLIVALLGGTVFVETVFALPGMGSLAATAANQQDVPVVQGVVVIFTLIIVIVNLITDIAYTWLDPRVRTS